MPAIPLVRLLKKRGPLVGVLDCLPDIEGRACVLAIDGSLLWGMAPDDRMERAVIEVDGERVGWACGSQAEVIASLVAYAASQENEKKSLAAELLERYRELNLLYHLSEVLSASSNPEVILQTALTEAIRIIPAQTGLILLRTGSSDALLPKVSWGSPYSYQPGNPLVEQALLLGKAGLANDVLGDELFGEMSGQNISVVCAPLKTEKNRLGVILLASTAERSFSAGELKLLNTIAQQAAPVVEVSRLHQVELEQARYEREMQMARQVQESLLPPEMPRLPGWQFDRRWHPVRDVSGDFYDVIREGPNHLGLVMADITDKGMPASLFMVFVRSALRASITRKAAPARVIQNANRVVCQDSYQGLFATMFYARLDTVSGEVIYSNAGHPPTLVYRRAQNELLPLAHTGMALGVDEGAVYSQQSTRLDPGDFLLFYTDGVIEAANPDGQEFTLERLAAVVQGLRNRSSSELLDGLEKALADYTAPLAPQDDVTLMIVMREA